MRVNRLAVGLLDPALVVLTPASAMADDGLGTDSGSSYQDNRSQSGRDGATSDRIRSCADEDGDVYYQRTRSHADENGTSTRHTSSGNGNCDAGEESSSSSGGDHDGRSEHHRSDSDRDDRSSRGGFGAGTVGFGDGRALLSVSLGNISVEQRLRRRRFQRR